MKTICLSAIALLCCISTYACDICGCSVSNYNPFQFPHLAKNYVGLSYLNRHYRLHGEDGSHAEQYVNTLLLSVQVNAGKKFQFTVLVPYQFTRLKMEGNNRQLNGIGDVSLLGSWKVWNKLTKTSRQAIMIGAGVKLPTGSYHPMESNKLQEQNFNVGSGSVDYIINGSYRLGLRQWVLNVSSSYKYNTTNKEQFRYGDVINSSLILGKRYEPKNVAFLPYIQTSWEKQLQDATKHILQQHSGGHVLSAGIGLDVNTKRFTAGIAFMNPINQNLALGSIKASATTSAHVAISF